MKRTTRQLNLLIPCLFSVFAALVPLAGCNKSEPEPTTSSPAVKPEARPSLPLEVQV